MNTSCVDAASEAGAIEWLFWVRCGMAWLLTWEDSRLFELSLLEMLPMC